MPHVSLRDGSNSSRPEDIRAVFAGHFSSLFRAAGEREETREFEARVAEFCGTLPKFPEELAAALTAPVTAEELWEVVKGMNAASGPGPDGVPLAFYKVFFAALKEPLLKMVNSFVHHGTHPDSFAEGDTSA